MRGMRDKVQNGLHDKGSPAKEKESGIRGAKTGGGAAGAAGSPTYDLGYAIRLLERIAYQTANTQLEMVDYLAMVRNTATDKNTVNLQHTW